MKDQDIVKLIELVGYKEGLPVVVDPGIIDPNEFIDEVVKVRLTNEYVPDTPQRIATDISQQLAIRFGETVKAYMRSDVLSASEIRGVPLVIAGWLRYLMGVDDQGNVYTPSDDPMLDELRAYLKDIKIGEPKSYKGQFESLLHNERLFGVDLYDCGLASKIEEIFVKLIDGKGSVRKTLEEYFI